MTKMILSLAMILSSAGNVFAANDHSGNGWQVLGHMLSEPDHLAMLSLVVVAAVFAVRHYRRQA